MAKALISVGYYRVFNKKHNGFVQKPLTTYCFAAAWVLTVNAD